MKKLMAFAVLLMSLAGCGSSDNETQMTVKVAAYRTSCDFGFGDTMCHMVWNEDGQVIGGWTSIAGFNFVWGHEYVLSVGQTISDEKNVEGPIITRRLIAVKSDQIVDPDTEFQYYSHNSTGVRNIQLTSATGGKLQDNTPFVCLGDAQCEALATLLEDPVSQMTMTFGYSAGTSLPLVLKSSTRI